VPATTRSTRGNLALVDRRRVRVPALSEADRQREAERLMARVRCGAAVLYGSVAAVKPGDSTFLTLTLGAVLVACAVAGLVTSRERRAQVGGVGVLFAAVDTALFMGILANNLENPSDAVYIAGLLPVLEGALRWARPGGLVLGTLVGGSIAAWTAVVASRAGVDLVAETMAVRAGAMVLMGWAVGSIVRSLQDQQLALQHALDASHDAMVTIDHEGLIASANDPCAELLGRSPDELIGECFADVLFPGGKGARYHELTTTLAEPYVTEVRYDRPDGTDGWLEVNVTPVERLGIAYAVCRDVTVRAEAATLLDHAAHHDPLTDLPNRRKLFDLLERTPVGGGSTALLFVDLDGFKAVNDRLGHDAGDELLRQAAARMKRCVRDGDVVARFAGDEFCVVLRPADPDVLRSVAERIVADLAAPFPVAGEDLRVGASVGGVTQREGEAADDLLRRADRTMYRAKEAGGSRAELGPDNGGHSSLDVRC
jgi:diguanylate cyclase (GGDEF)-like protein/PAS domain S-box-containing protein